MESRFSLAFLRPKKKWRNVSKLRFTNAFIFSWKSNDANPSWICFVSAWTVWQQRRFAYQTLPIGPFYEAIRVMDGTANEAVKIEKTNERKLERRTRTEAHQYSADWSTLKLEKLSSLYNLNTKSEGQVVRRAERFLCWVWENPTLFVSNQAIDTSKKKNRLWKGFD